MESDPPIIIGVGGTTGGASSTEHALSIALGAARVAGVRTRLFGGDALSPIAALNPMRTVAAAEG